MDSLWSRKNVTSFPNVVQGKDLNMIYHDGKQVCLGSGTFGDVYLAYYTSHSVYVAIKFFRKKINTIF